MRQKTYTQLFDDLGDRVRRGQVPKHWNMRWKDWKRDDTTSVRDPVNPHRKRLHVRNASWISEVLAMLGMSKTQFVLSFDAVQKRSFSTTLPQRQFRELMEMRFVNMLQIAAYELDGEHEDADIELNLLHYELETGHPRERLYQLVDLYLSQNAPRH